MQVIIDISEDGYNILKNYTGHLTYSEYLIKNGKPLPKGHGDLIDRSALEPDADYEDGVYYAYSRRQIDDAETIIKSDRSDEE